MKGFRFGVIWLMLAVPAVPQTVNKATLANQNMCGDAAKAYFREQYGNGIDSSKEVSAFSTYTAHYNSRLNRCFIRVETTTTHKDNRSQMVDVSDVFEKKSYGNLIKNFPSGGRLCYVYN